MKTRFAVFAPTQIVASEAGEKVTRRNINVISACARHPCSPTRRKPFSPLVAPQVEDVVQVDVRQQRRHRRNESQQLRVSYPVLNKLHQPPMIDGVEGATDVHIEHIQFTFLLLLMPTASAAAVEMKTVQSRVKRSGPPPPLPPSRRCRRTRTSPRPCHTSPWAPMPCYLPLWRRKKESTCEAPGVDSACCWWCPG
jgi:hypothetical protein